jgi:hypothetical protein
MRPAQRCSTFLRGGQRSIIIKKFDRRSRGQPTINLESLVSLLAHTTLQMLLRR